MEWLVWVPIKVPWGCHSTIEWPKIRATAATRLYNAGVDEQMIMETTGHRSLEGVRSYKRTSECQKKSVSDILNVKLTYWHTLITHRWQCNRIHKPTAVNLCLQTLTLVPATLPSISLCLHPTTNVLTVTEHYHFMSLPKTEQLLLIVFL